MFSWHSGKTNILRGCTNPTFNLTNICYCYSLELKCPQVPCSNGWIPRKVPIAGEGNLLGVFMALEYDLQWGCGWNPSLFSPFTSSHEVNSWLGQVPWLLSHSIPPETNNQSVCLISTRTSKIVGPNRPSFSVNKSQIFVIVMEIQLMHKHAFKIWTLRLKGS